LGFELPYDLLVADLRTALDEIRRSVIWAWRSLRRRPGLSAVVVLSLGLATGGTTAVFSFVNGILLRPLAVADPEQLVRVRENWAAPGEEPQLRSVNPATFLEWRRGRGIFAGIAAAFHHPQTLTDQGEPEEIEGCEVSADFFRVLGVRPLLGRDFLAAEEQPGRDAVVLLGYELWRRRFGGDRRILGTTLRLNGVRRVVVGILPRGIRHPYQAELWVPLVLDAQAPVRIGNSLYVPARLRPGVGAARAEREMNELTERLQREHELPPGPHGARLVPLRKELLRNLDVLLGSLLAAAIFVLAIACANVSSLLLAQSYRRTPEAALRVALGAGSGRLFGLFLAQGLLYALLGGALGVLVAGWSIGPIFALSPLPGVAISELGREVTLDWPTLAFTLVVAVVAGVLLGLVPALRARRIQPQDALRTGGRAASLGRAGRRFTSGLVVAEIALAVLLLIGASLVARGFERLRRTDWGFAPQRLLVVDLNVQAARYPDAGERVRFVDRAVARLAAVPGVTAAAATTLQPFADAVAYCDFDVPGQPAPNPPGHYLTHHRLVSPGYLETMGIALLAGRSLTPADERLAGTSAVVVSKSFADRFWPGGSALGKRLAVERLAPAARWLTVVGVAADLPVETGDSYLNLNNVKLTWYVPHALGDLSSVSLVLRTSARPESLIPAVRSALREVDREQAVARMASMDEEIDRYLGRERFSTFLDVTFGLLGLLLAMLGIYGAMSFFVAQQHHEIGIRVALGARPLAIRGMILRQVSRLTLAGLALGLVGAFGLRRFLASLLFGLAPTDPAVLGFVAVVVSAAALAAGVMPAVRAGRVEAARVIAGGGG
jgi:putative ABC transport system permease protein